MTDQQISNSDPRSYPNTIGPTAAINMSPGIVVRSDGTDNGCTAALADSDAHSRTIGINRHFVEAGNTANVCYAGPVQLTEDEWDTIAGTEGGLDPGDTYYLSAADAGHLTTTAPGNAVVVGVALSSTSLLVGIVNLVEGA